MICDIGILLFGILSAIPLSSDDDKSPGYGWLLFCRFGVGSFAGGTSQRYVRTYNCLYYCLMSCDDVEFHIKLIFLHSITYYSEFLPQKGRGIALTFMDVSINCH